MGRAPGPKQTYDHHLADVPTAELRIGRVVHIDHPAAHEDAQPDQQDILDPEAWEPALLREGSGEEVPIIPRAVSTSLDLSRPSNPAGTHHLNNEKHLAPHHYRAYARVCIQGLSIRDKRTFQKEEKNEA